MIYFLLLLSLLHAECGNLLRAEPSQLLIVPGQAEDVQGYAQSRFVGPVDLNVWRHWQPSWNVENVTQGIRFELIRGEDGLRRAYVRLRYRDAKPTLKARIGARVLERDGTWGVREKIVDLGPVDGVAGPEWTDFWFEGATDLIDQDDVRVVTQIGFGIYDDEREVYHYGLEPMFARGRYWNNPIEGYSAHAGSGAISVETLFDAEKGWKVWNGQVVGPELGYIERNKLEKDAVIGLHRHERNQEVWQVESGLFVVHNGMAARSGPNASVERPWDSAGKMVRTDQFPARGGWIESRHLGPGELSIIVPNPNQSDNVQFHGIRAVTDGIFWTMGKKN